MRARQVLIVSSSSNMLGSLSTVGCVRRPGALVAGARTRSLTRFFFHTSLNFVVKMLLQPPEMKFNKEKKR